MKPKSFRNLSWVVLIVVFALVQIVIQLVWFHYGFSLTSWSLVQVLVFFWLVSSVYKKYHSAQNWTSPDNSVTRENQAVGSELNSVVNVEQLVGSVVHEVRKPLNRLRMRLDQADDSSLAKSLSGDVGELEDIIERVERVFRDTTPGLRWISVPRLFQLVVEEREFPNVKFVTGMSWIYCSPTSMKIVFLNLIENSLEAYDGPNGSVTIEAEQLGPEFCLKIRDQAGGINPELARTINRDVTKESTGMGLGLLISQKIVKNHQGRMVIESEKDEGTTVTITLPVPGEDGRGET